jgi:hypothetical protein
MELDARDRPTSRTHTGPFTSGPARSAGLLTFQRTADRSRTPQTPLSNGPSGRSLASRRTTVPSLLHKEDSQSQDRSR